MNKRQRKKRYRKGAGSCRPGCPMCQWYREAIVGVERDKKDPWRGLAPIAVAGKSSRLTVQDEAGGATLWTVVN